ncbi:MAG: HDOD domain-containing protein, partial [Calditrichia bacterium]|nr:HDOD domain-containing protein [Calditrichia bacterium]
MVESNSIQKFIKSINEIYSIPSVALKVIQQITDPEVRISDLSKLIQVDQVLTSNILKVVNSGYFNFQDEIVTIKKVIVLMGLKLTKEVTISFAV